MLTGGITLEGGHLCLVFELVDGVPFRITRSRNYTLRVQTLQRGAPSLYC